MRLFFFLLFLASVGLLLFSFTQIDLSLTLSDKSLIQSVQRNFQYVGFYQRPLATALYCFLLTLLTAIYLGIMRLSQTKILKEKHVWIGISVLVGILFFSFPAAFSYDIFNYIFTAKTILIYGKNPYIIKPMDLQGIDSMLSFMRWTHLPSAYTPLWIGLTLFPFLLSFGTLLLATWMMKLVPIASYVMCVWCIGRILKKTHPKHTLLGMTAFAFNPLIIIEVLVSAHNDIVMMAFALGAYLLSLQKKRLASFFVFSLSVAAKFITIFLVPLFVFKWSAKKALVLQLIALVVVLLRREFLPWYFIWIIPFVVLIPDMWSLFPITVGVSVGLLLRYAPVFYFGHYNDPVPYIQNLSLFIPIMVGILYCGTVKLLKK